MKKKKKLKLNRTTIKHLPAEKLPNANGGGLPVTIKCQDPGGCSDPLRRTNQND